MLVSYLISIAIAVLTCIPYTSHSTPHTPPDGTQLRIATAFACFVEQLINF
ncbi:hypothetical protein AVDCRST_MAG94-3379 [uncultured Leptolyngbya sp.]|uniref:Uncharacterized protein n=1 Tax=uncultured Leptolyngbya sp. TaxID=332963 RepID=A0A6J4MIZ8_9CYAN|nr:hypothetical protein AVDCRST_MAG94-3379 [uncultured Leptolyngbya sp.]